MQYRVPAFLILAGTLHAVVLAAVVTQSWTGREAPSPAPLAVVLLGASAGAGPVAAATPVATAATLSLAETTPAATPASVAIPKAKPVAEPPARSVPRTPAAPRTRPSDPDRFATPAPDPADPSGTRPLETGTRSVTPVLASRPATGIAPETGPAIGPDAALQTAPEGVPDTSRAMAPPGGVERTLPRIDASWHGNTPPAYPLRARRAGEQGEVLLDVHVDEQGRVTEVLIKRSSGSSLLDRAAIGAVRDWRFQPATEGGEPVADWYRDWRWVFRLAG